jgi:hypothetical protein
MLCTGCLISPGITPEPEERNLPPYLDFMEPEIPQVIADSPAPINFSVRAFDPNREESLYWFVLGEETFPDQGEIFRLPGESLQNGVFYRFEPIEFEVEPCGDDLAGESRETIWVYVSDRPLTISNRTVIPEGEYLESFAWIIDIRPEACQQ